MQEYLEIAVIVLVIGLAVAFLGRKAWTRYAGKAKDGSCGSCGLASACENKKTCGDTKDAH